MPARLVQSQHKHEGLITYGDEVCGLVFAGQVHLRECSLFKRGFGRGAPSV